MRVLAHPVGHKPTASEEIWLQIVKVTKKNKSFIGVVNTQTLRSTLHGLQFGMQIAFEAKHILAVGMVYT